MTVSGGSDQNAILKVGRFINRVAYRYVNIFSRFGLNRHVISQVRRLAGEDAAAEVLNVGASGKLSRLVDQVKAARVLHTDIDPEKQPDIVADLCSMPEIEDDRFAAAFALEVLEHVTDPLSAMRELHRVLKPGGHLMISTPFVFETHEAPYDYYRYTRHGVELLLKDFTDISVTPRNGYMITLLVPALRLIMSKHPSDWIIAWVICVLSVPLVPILLLLDLAIRSDAVATGYVAIARKPG